jgi:hypothetical protein
MAQDENKSGRHCRYDPMGGSATTGCTGGQERSVGLSFVLFRLMFYFTFILLPRSRDSSVGIATGWAARVRFPAVQKCFSSPQRPVRLWGPMGTGSSFAGIKRQGREGDHSISAEVKKSGAITGTNLPLNSNYLLYSQFVLFFLSSFISLSRHIFSRISFFVHFPLASFSPLFSAPSVSFYTFYICLFFLLLCSFR